MRKAEALDAAMSRKDGTWERAMLGVGMLALVVGLALFLREAVLWLHLFEFPDETEKFVAAQMIDHGLRLYRDIFAHHGPVPYLLAHLYTLLVSRSDFDAIRIVPILLAQMSAAAVFSAPVLRTAAARAWAAATYLLLLAAVWAVQGMHLLLYQQIGGFLLAVACLHLFVPLLFGFRPKGYGVAAAGAAIVTACFCAYSFGLAAVLLTAACLLLLVGTVTRGERQRVVAPFLCGILLALAAISLWMLLFADFKGFYVYHFYFNQQVYTLFFHYSLKDMLQVFSFSLAPEAIVHTFALPLFSLWALHFLLSSAGKGSSRLAATRILACILFAAAVVSMNPRGWNGFHDNAFLVVNFSLFGVASAMILERNLPASSAVRPLWTIFLVILPLLMVGQASQYAVTSPYGVNRDDWHRYLASLKPEEGGVYEVVRSLAAKDRDFLSLVFNPINYIKADRLPASGHYYYLPWQAAYNWKPVAGYRIDICADIRSRTPAVIFFDDWKVRDILPLAKYQSCVLESLKADYLPLGPKGPLFVRKDLVAGGLDPAQAGTTAMQLSPPLDSSSPIPLRMTAMHQGRQAGLKRIGLLLGASGLDNSGEAELRLWGTDGAVFIHRFTWTDSDDNEYRYFDLDGKPYSSGEIVFQAGSGLTVWERRGVQGYPVTCLAYEYDDGKRGFTPGCPPY